MAYRIKRNIIEKGDVNPLILKDVIRGTMVFSESTSLESKITSLIDDAKEIPGIKVKKIEAKEDLYYKGIHLNLTYSKEISIEVQFHTENSWKLKQIGDIFYDKYRSKEIKELSPEEKRIYDEEEKKPLKMAQSI